MSEQRTPERIAELRTRLERGVGPFSVEDQYEWFEETLPKVLDILESQRDELETAKADRDWAAQFTCPKCGPMSYAMVTTKKTCLSCDSSLIRGKYPPLARMEAELEAARAVIGRTRTMLSTMTIAGENDIFNKHRVKKAIEAYDALRSQHVTSGEDTE